MAVVVEGWAVVARRTVVETTLADGLDTWTAATPNRMTCADLHLCICAFMARDDAAAFAMKLEAMGLRGERDGEYRDLAIVDGKGPWAHACPWLAFGRYAGVSALWLADHDPEPLVVPLGWRPNQLINLSEAEAAKRLKFLRREGDVEVYLDTETGEEMYRGRTAPRDAMPDDVETTFKAVATEVRPFLSRRDLGFFERRKLAKAIATLEALAHGDRWRVWWFLGLARRAFGNDTGAFDALARAYAVNPAHPDVGREFAGQCLAVGEGARAVEIGERTCALHPHDATLRSNLALACMIAGDLPRAKAEVTRALAMDPSATITKALAQMIDEVIAGKRQRPTKYP